MKSSRLPYYILQDAVKWTIAPAKLMLEGVNLWPGQQSMIFNILIFLNISIMQVAHAAYFFSNITDLTEMASSCTTVTTTLQGMVKMLALIYHRDELHKAISTICHEFWSSKMMDENLKTKLEHSSWYYVGLSSPFLTLGGVGCYAFMIFPLISGDRHLPLMSLFPFDHTQSPVYEILYLWQYLTNFFLLFIISGFEFIFMGLVWNCIAQMRIIRSVLFTVVKEEKQDIMQTVRKEKEPIKFGSEDSEMMILLECIKHHGKVVKVCNKLEKIFSRTVLYLYFNSILAICASTFILSFTPSQIGKMLPYCLSHIGQFSLYAELGNELVYQSTTLPDAAFQCGWHLSNNIELRKTLIFFMMRSQQAQRLTVGGFTTLNLYSFLNVLKTSFSFYTVLNKLMEKKKEIM